MHPNELFDYALGRLQGPRRLRLEQSLASDPALSRRAARLIRNLQRLLDDGLAPSALPKEPPEPPRVRPEDPGASDSC